MTREPSPALDAFANTFGPFIVLGFVVFMFVYWYLADKAEARATQTKIGKHVVAPDRRLWRIAKETRLNGDVWFVAERWENGDWRAPYTGEFKTAEVAQSWLDAHFEYDRARLVATREPVSQ